MIIRKEHASDAPTISRITEMAFRDMQHSSHTEQYIVDALRESGNLTLSLVAEQGQAVIGHIAISPVIISPCAQGWYGLGPLSVEPNSQQRGIGSALVQAALDLLKRSGAAGCVVLGEPGYYSRFGFQHDPGLILPGIPGDYFQALSFGAPIPSGTVAYHDSFNARS